MRDDSINDCLAVSISSSSYPPTQHRLSERASSSLLQIGQEEIIETPNQRPKLTIEMIYCCCCCDLAKETRILAVRSISPPSHARSLKDNSPAITVTAALDHVLQSFDAKSYSLPAWYR